jgi:hypothetical protein
MFTLFQLRQFRDNRLDISPQHWLATGEPDLLDSQPYEDLANSFNLFVGKHLLFGSDRWFTMRQAIEAAEIATIRERHAQISDCAAV